MFSRQLNNENIIYKLSSAIFSNFLGVKNMKSFKDYTPKNNERTGAGTSQTQFDEAGIEELAQQLASAYAGKSNLQMLSSILAEAEKAKREGRLSNAQIDEFYAQFSPMLNDFQRKKLKEIVAKLKEI